MLVSGNLCFLNRSVQGQHSIPWSGESPLGSTLSSRAAAALPKLWFYHLNYCDFLNLDLSRPTDARLLASALDVALDWIRANRRTTRIAWDPYLLSLRVVNWLKFVARNGRAADAIGRGADIRRMIDSVGVQVSWLRSHVEEDLGGNHPVKNAKALLFAGALLDGAESGRWWKQGSELLARELDEQVLADGGHFERSAMYHCQVLEDLLDVQALSAVAPRELACRSELRAAIVRMASFLEAILHPDGEIPLLNDSAFGTATHGGELLKRARALQPGWKLASVSRSSRAAERKCSVTAAVLADSGYAVLRDYRTSSFAILDAGPLGPDYQPGHGHCDLLSCELSLDGQRIVTDTGVSTYERGEQRLYERSTAAHNTVRIDGEEQAEVWASFRVGRRPRADRMDSGECACSLGRITWVRGRHFAYAHRGVIHTRTLAAGSSNIWVVLDDLEGEGRYRLESFIHFHPSVDIEAWPAAPSDKAKTLLPMYVLHSASKSYLFVASVIGEIAPSSSWYAPEFGRRERRSMISWTWHGELPARLTYAFVPLTDADTRWDDLAASLDQLAFSIPDSGGQQRCTRP